MTAYTIILALTFAVVFVQPSAYCCQGFSSSSSSTATLQRRPNNGVVSVELQKPTLSTTRTTFLSMGIFDFIQENFLDSRDGDFIPLKNSDDDTPGPLILMYAVPDSMDDEEFMDMIEDGMGAKDEHGVVIQRIAGTVDCENYELLDLTVGEALTKAMKDGTSAAPSSSPFVSAIADYNNTHCPVLLFSGISNTDMMSTYRIVANEIYEETGGVHWPACAKVVKPAMSKSLRQVLEEISGDHAEAMRIQREEAEKEKDA